MTRRSWSAFYGFALLAVTLLALLPRPIIVTTDIGWDKLNHLLAFSTLALIGSVAWYESGRNHQFGLALWLMAWGVWIEAAQAMTQSRSAEFNDLVADAIGIAVGLMLSALLQARSWARPR